jgi:RNA polymerase sigma-70 factor (ECF subfamily)
MTIARSRALDRLRSLRRRRAEEPALGDDPASAGSANRLDAAAAAAAAAIDAPALGADPSVAAEAVERRERVLAALGELPPEQREALELAYFEGLSQSEVAERTGQPLGTVKTRMRLGMQKLRQKLSVLREGGP